MRTPVRTGLFRPHIARAPPPPLRSQALPFLEYDLHRQLQHKLKIHGKNALFGLRLSVSVGETLMIASAEATGVCVASLPLTPPLRIRRNLEVLDEEDKQLVAMQRQARRGEGEREGKLEREGER
eukprot:124927-Pleurochrysis_carterae.AAC.1